MLVDLDKQSLSYAAVFGLIPDLKLSGEQYSWCSFIVYIGQSLLSFLISLPDIFSQHPRLR